MAIWFVDGDAISSGDGKSWATAFATLEDAIAHAGGGDEIWVKQGTYVISSTLAVSTPVQIYASFAGTESERSQRNWQNNETTVDGAGYPGCFKVTADAVINGFVITGAYGESGIYNDSCSPIITNCTFFGNSVHDYGGGIFNHSSSPIIANCILWGDTAGETGSEIYDESVSPATVIYCDIDQEGYEGDNGNIRQDPLFGADLHLQANSPCIDKADPASAPPYDIDGEARPELGGTNVDMGADEFYDSDGDEMPDYWEMKYDLNPSVNDSSFDPDGDGRTNLEEYQNGTNPIDASPTAEIYSPSNGAYNVGDLISFSGTGYDLEDGELIGDSLVWTSSINGLIGTGTNVSSNELVPGTHTITLTATDSQGATVSTEITLQVDELPA